MCKISNFTITVGGVTTNSAESLGAHTDLATAHTALEKLPDLKVLLADQQAMAEAMETVTTTSVQVVQDVKDGKNVLGNATKIVGGNTINVIALAGNIITGNMDVDNAIASFQDPYKMAEAIKANQELAATLDAFSKGEFDNLPKTKEGLQALADATGLKVDVLLTTVTNYQDAKGTTDKNLVALDVNPDNRADIVSTLAHEESHARGGTNETLADMSGYATQLLSEAAIGSYDQQYLNGIKFELGTGNDAQTQAANQVLLGSDNETLLNALNDHQLEFQNKTMVYIWKGVSYGASAYGHVSASVNDTSYSFGRDGMDIRPLGQYLNMQTEFRNGLAVEIPLTAKEEKQFENFLKSYDSPYWINYCPSPVNQGLHELGYKFDSQIIPMSLYMELMRNNIGKNPTVIEKTK